MDIKSALALSLINTLGLLTLPMARGFGRFIAWILIRSNSRLYKVTQKNLELCYPDMPAAEREQLAKDSVLETAKSIAETGIAWGGTEKKFKRNAGFIHTVRNEHLFQQAMAKQEGILFLTPHIGNWEFLTSWLPQRCELNALYKIAKMPGFEKAMLKARESSGVRMYPGTSKGVKGFMQSYKDKGVALILPDQEPSEKSGVWADFFGVSALTPKSVHSLMKKNPAGTVLFVYAIRSGEGLEVIFREAPAAIYSEDVNESALAMNQGIEACIVDAPAQYQWEYKRFKRSPKQYYKGL